MDKNNLLIQLMTCLADTETYETSINQSQQNGSQSIMSAKIFTNISSPNLEQQYLA